MSYRTANKGAFQGAPGLGAIPDAPVLVVEDNTLVRLALVDTLEEAGLPVVEAHGGDAAAGMLRGGLLPSVVVTDVNIGPGPDGYALADHVHRLCPGVSVVFITGRPDQPPQRSLRPGEHMMLKPFPVTDLIELIGTCTAPARG